MMVSDGIETVAADIFDIALSTYRFYSANVTTTLRDGTPILADLFGFGGFAIKSGSVAQFASARRRCSGEQLIWAYPSEL
jgi:hypothetical protein